MFWSWTFIILSLAANGSPSLGVHVDALQLDADFSDPSKAGDSVRNLLHILHAPVDHLDSISIVTVTGFEELGNWTLLGDVFDRLHKLEDVRWSAKTGVPATILRHLENNNRACRLHYEIHSQHVDSHSPRIQDQITVWNYDNASEITRLEILERERQHKDRQTVIGFSNLYSLRANIAYASEPNYEDLSLVFDILTTCPNLRILDLRIHYVGDSYGARTPQAFDFMSKPHIRFPPLEILKISGYNFNERSDGGYAWDWRNVSLDCDYEDWHRDDPPVPPARRENDGRSQLDCWKECIDWSQLHTLEITLPSTDVLMGLRDDALPALTNLSLELSFPLTEDWGKDLLDFLKGTKLPLEGLSLSLRAHDLKSLSKNELVDDIVSHHGPRLKSLSLLTDNDGESQILNRDQIQRLLRGCTKSNNLDISVSRPATGEDILQFQYLASAPMLQSITLRFPSPDLDYGSTEYWEKLKFYIDNGGADDEVDPVVNKISVTRLFEGLRSRREVYLESKSHIRRLGMAPPHGLEEFYAPLANIESLKIYVGNWDRRQDQVMMPSFRRVAFWKCRITERGIAVCEGEQLRGSQ